MRRSARLVLPRLGKTSAALPLEYRFAERFGEFVFHHPEPHPPAGSRQRGASVKYKLFVFDLDETLWTVSEGLCTLVQPPFRLEGPDRVVGKDGLWVELFPGARDLLTV